VTPTSQIVGTQAVQNVLVGRYKMISKQVMEYCCGQYGRPPAPIDPEVMEKVFKFYRKNATVIDCRPADLLKPEMEAAKESVKDFTTDPGDILIAAIYPLTGVAFLKKKYGIEAPPVIK
jgi:pyruvate carboxylase subunit B